MKKIIFFCLIALHIRAQDQPELVITNGHNLTIRSMAYHPSGKFIATASEDNTIKIWDLSLRQEFRTLYGHVKNLRQISFTPDGKYLISIDDGGQFIFWDPFSGQRLGTYKGDFYVKPFSTGIASNTVKLYNQDDSIVTVEVPSGKMLKGRKVEDDRYFTCLKSDNEFAAISGDLKSLEICSMDSEEPLKSIPLDGKSYDEKIIYNAKENLCALFNQNGILIVDLSSGAVKAKCAYPAGEMMRMLCFTNDGKKLIAATINARIYIYDCTTGKETMNIQEFPKNPDYTKDFSVCNGLFNVIVSPDDKFIAIDGQLAESKKFKTTIRYVSIIYNLATGKRVGMLEGNMKLVNNLAVVNNGKYLCTGVVASPNSGVKFWNLRDGSIIKNIPGWSSSFSRKADKACVVMDSITVFNTSDYNIEKVIKLKTITGAMMSDDGNYMVATTINTASPTKSQVYVYDTRTYSLAAKYQVEAGSHSMRTRISPDSKYLLGVDGKKLDVCDLLTGKQILQKGIEASLNKILTFVPGKNLALVCDYDFPTDSISKVHVIDYVKGEEVDQFKVATINMISSAEFSPDNKTIAIGSSYSFGDDFNIYVYDWESKTLKCTLKGHHNAIDFLSWNPEGNVIYSASMDGTAKAWDMNNCNEKGTFICMNGPEEYIIHSPDYYYKCSKGNYEGICFRYKNKLYRFDQFDLILNRPDIVMERLGSPKLLVAMYRQAWKKRLARLGYTEEMLKGNLSLPDAEIVDKEKIAQNGGKIKFILKAKDAASNINRVNVFVNNVPLYGEKGMDVSGEKSKSISKEISFELSNGLNRVDVMVINDQGLESPKESFVMEYNPPAIAKPNLYIFAVGVSRFKDTKHNLVFSVKDAGDFVNMMKTNSQFGKVEVVMLKDSMASRESIVSSSKFLEKAGINDEVIIYFSSHGLLDNKLDYYLATYDVNFDEPAAKGLPYEEIENMLSKVPARNRLVLIDACHSGEVDKEGVEIVSNNKNADAANVKTKAGNFEVKPKAGLKNSFAYMQALFSDVSKGSGATVISAAGGNEFALESKDWNNGVFTYSILKGLKNNEADLNKDKIINISELKFYVIDQVSELTGGKQTPTARKENEVNNFVIYRK